VEIIAGKPYALKEWPDSSYIANLDSVADAEYVNPHAQKAPEVSMSPSIMPMPGKVGKQVHGAANPPKPGIEKSNSGAKLAEAFAERFQNAMEKLQADPKNTGNYRDVTVQDGENLQAVLARVYGAESKALAFSVVQSQLNAVNGRQLDNLKPGVTLHLPRL